MRVRPADTRAMQRMGPQNFLYDCEDFKLISRCVQENIVVIARHYGRIAALQKESSLELDSRLDEANSTSLPTEDSQVRSPWEQLTLSDCFVLEEFQHP